MAAAAPKKRTKKKKYDKEQEYVNQLEKEIRELKSINRSLLRQIKKLSKGINRLEFEQALERIEDGPQEKPRKRPESKRCPSCGAVGIREVEVAGRRFESCGSCDYRSGRIK